MVRQTRTPRLNEDGQAVIETAFIAPLVITFFLLMASVAWLSWIRFELSQMGQTYLACLDSNQTQSICRNHFQSQLQALPGVWRYEKATEEQDQLILSVRSARWSWLWTFTERKNWRLPH